MGLDKTDFLLTDEQLNCINHYFEECATRRALDGEDPPQSAKVVFSWAHGFGRCVDAFFDGCSTGCAIEDPFANLSTQTT
jgi:hypothetical protein